MRIKIFIVLFFSLIVQYGVVSGQTTLSKEEGPADLRSRTSTASANVHLLSQEFDMGMLEKRRKIWIYLPEGYEKSNKEYPVLYMHDGQNLFDELTSYAGEWEVDETLDHLSESQALELIVVGIENDGQQRMHEYVPYKLDKYDSRVEGAAYVKFITEVLKPFVDMNYRTLADREHTGVMGSSLGGLISFYAAMEFEEYFGRAGVFSPSFELIDPEIRKEQIIKPLRQTRLYLMCGDQESQEMVPEMQKIVKEMMDLGFEPDNICAKVVKGGKHNEGLWLNEFESAVRWLFTNEM
jgi:predicted alpha/beta superfamily hydrolase